MKRREFISLLGGAAAWPLAARAQQGERMRRIGVLINLAADDPQGRARGAAIREGLQQLGWIDGRNVQFDYRWAAGDPGRIRRYAEELVALAPDAIVCHGSGDRRTVAAGHPHDPDRIRLRSRSRRRRLCKEPCTPGRQCHRFHRLRIWPGREMVGAAEADRSPRYASGRHSRSRHYRGDWPIRRDPGCVAVAWSGREPGWRSRYRRDRGRHHGAFARSPNSGLIVSASALAVAHRNVIITLAAKHKLPAVYYDRFFASAGGLISYGPDTVDQFRRAGRLRRPHPQGRETGRPASAGAESSSRR